MTRRALPLVLVLALFSGCYRTTYTTNLPRGETKHVWSDFYALGLIGHAEIDAKQLCPTGVAQIVAFQTVSHVLLMVITIGVYTPRSLYLTCAGASK